MVFALLLLAAACTLFAFPFLDYLQGSRALPSTVTVGEGVVISTAEIETVVRMVMERMDLQQVCVPFLSILKKFQRRIAIFPFKIWACCAQEEGSPQGVLGAARFESGILEKARKDRQANAIDAATLEQMQRNIRESISTGRTEDQAALTAASKQLSGDLAGTAAGLAATKEALSAAKTELAAKCEDEVAACKQENQAAIAGLHEEFSSRCTDGVQACKQHGQAAIDELSKDIDAKLLNLHSATQGEIAQAKGSAMSEALAGANTAVEAAKTELKTIIDAKASKDEIEALKAALEATKREIEAAVAGTAAGDFTEAKLALQAELERQLESARTATKSEIVAAQGVVEGRVDAVKEEVAASRDSFRANKDEIDALKLALADTKASIEASEAGDAEALGALKAELEQQLENKLQSERAATKSEIVAAQGVVIEQATSSAKEDLKTSIDAKASKDEIEALKAALEATKREIEAAVAGTAAGDFTEAKLALKEELEQRLEERIESFNVHTNSLFVKHEGVILQRTREGVKADLDAVKGELNAQIEAATSGLSGAANAATSEAVKALEAKIDALEKAREDGLDAKLAGIEAKLVEQIINIVKVEFSGKSGVNGDDVTRIVEERLAVYEADKTDRIDYALYSAGGRVLGASASHTKPMKCNPLLSVFRDCNAPVNEPREVLNDDMSVGNCWPMSGANGYVLVRLREDIVVSHVTYEHSPLSITPDASTVPREIVVMGVPDSATRNGKSHGEESEDEVQLGRFTFDINKGAMQTFEMFNKPRSFRTLRFKVLDNSGNPDYTCLYRLRVHGDRP